MKKSFLLPILIIVLCATFASAQHLPNLPNKPTPQFELHSFCAPEGKPNSTDPELNRRKNRIDSPSSFNPVDFAEIKTLAAPASAGGKVRSNWTTNERKAIEKFEGIPITVEGFLALVNNAKHGDPPKIEGARPEGKESCNCDSTQPAQVDFHIWLLFAANDNRKDAIVVEMTPRVRAHHPTWTVATLTSIANQKLPVRISGWLMYDGQHPEQLPPGTPAQPSTRATLWEIHPIVKVEFKQNGVWKTL